MFVTACHFRIENDNYVRASGEKGINNVEQLTFELRAENRREVNIYTYTFWALRILQGQVNVGYISKCVCTLTKTEEFSLLTTLSIHSLCTFRTYLRSSVPTNRGAVYVFKSMEFQNWESYNKSVWVLFVSLGIVWSRSWRRKFMLSKCSNMTPSRAQSHLHILAFRALPRWKHTWTFSPCIPCAIVSHFLLHSTFGLWGFNYSKQIKK